MTLYVFNVPGFVQGAKPYWVKCKSRKEALDGIEYYRESFSVRIAALFVVRRK